MSEPDDGEPDWEVEPDPDNYVPVAPHKVVVVCPSSLARRTRWHMGIVRRRAQRVLCPACGRKAFWEVTGTTSESAHFEFG